jgi:hypothetical protein
MIAMATPAAAQVNVGVNVSFDYFYDRLSPYGEWYYHPRWGDVWHPTRVGADFRPYYRGHWVNTVEYGWTWNSDDPWGGVPYHYGRWVFDPVDGWLWVPGYTWAPAWVVWRGGGNNIGWFPMPPDDQFLAGVEVYRDDWNWDRGYYGYADWYGPTIATGLLAAWTFVALDHFADRDYYRYAYQRPQVVNIINNTTNVTNYTTVNNRIINRSVDVTRVEQASGRRIERVEARSVVRTPIATVDSGRQIATRERERHGGNVRASARDRVIQLPAAEARTPVRERRDARFQRELQQAEQPNAQQPPNAQPGGRADREQERAQQQREQAQRNGAQQQERAQQQQRERDNRAATERQQRDQAQRNAVQQQQERAQQQSQQQQRERDNRAAIERQQRDQAEQQNRARAEQQNRARAEQAQRQQQVEQQNRARAEQQQRAQAQQQQRAQAEQQNRARAEQQRAQAQQQQRAQAEQQNRARAEQAQRQQQQAAAQQRQRGKAQSKEEEEKQKRERN